MGLDDFYQVFQELVEKHQLDPDTAELPAEAREKGYVLKESQKTITVEGLDSYVENLGQICEADREKLMANWRTCLRQTTIFSNFTLSEDTYKIEKKEYTIIPFTVDTTGKYYWWGREYFENQTEKIFTGATGYFVAKYLTVDVQGNLVDEQNVYYEVGGIYENNEQMETAIYAEHGV